MDVRKLHGARLGSDRCRRAQSHRFVGGSNEQDHPEGGKTENRHDRKPTWPPETPEGRWRSYTYDELLARDKVSLDIFWLRDESLEDSASLPEPDLLAAEIVQDLQAALEQFAAIAEDLEGEPSLEDANVG